MDASVGLAFSLKLFQRYRRTGILQAQVRHIPGIQGMCTAYVHLIDGAVTACYVENNRGERFQSSPSMLIRIDSEKGPFEWTFQVRTPPSPVTSTSLPGSAVQSPANIPPLPPLSDTLIPTVVAPLRWEQFSNWSFAQKQMLQSIWKMLDGKHTIQEIKASLPLPPQTINDVLHILLSSRLIIFAS
ncbi:MAG: hypothetical protein J2P37_08755 [Ktedonobacteraceae bacterium]|nr:hypothetical protein [Ktedonobacteraceae bacterium]MBO0791461.1 hypothetical protein [Ktedonobacteraceae bacterium]